VPDIRAIKDWTVRAARRAAGGSAPDTLGIAGWTVRAARLMVGVPDYETYVRHMETNHPGKPVMTYEEFFVERQEARYAVGKGRFRGCC
jgi:uncharacterized short protein YbdD (DUF466 family)